MYEITGHVSWILSKLTVPEQARVPIWANELQPNPKGLNSSLVISTLARSGEFSSNKTQQLFTIVYLGFLWRLLSHPSAQHIPGILNFLWVVTVNSSLAITTLACSGEYRLTNVMFPMLFVCCIATATHSGTIFSRVQATEMRYTTFGGYYNYFVLKGSLLFSYYL